MESSGAFLKRNKHDKKDPPAGLQQQHCPEGKTKNNNQHYFAQLTTTFFSSHHFCTEHEKHKYEGKVVNNFGFGIHVCLLVRLTITVKSCFDTLFIYILNHFNFFNICRIGT